MRFVSRPLQAHSPSISGALTLLDNFNSKTIDPEVWWGSEHGSAPDTPIEEVLRGTVPNTFTGVGRLLGLVLTSYGDRLSNTGSVRQEQGLNMQDPGGITGLKANVVIHKATAESCLANPDPSRTGTRLIGALFNSVSAAQSGTGDRTGDVLATFEKVLDSGTGAVPIPKHHIVAFLILCDNADCTSSTVLPGAVTFTKSWAFDVSQELEWEWVNVSNEVVFTVGPGSLHPEAHAVNYSQVNKGGPGSDFKSVRVFTEEAACTAARRQSSTEAGFDNVSTNP